MSDFLFLGVLDDLLTVWGLSDRLNGDAHYAGETDGRATGKPEDLGIRLCIIDEVVCKFHSVRS